MTKTIKDPRAASKIMRYVLKPAGSTYIDYVLDKSQVSPPVAVGFYLNCIDNFDAGEACTESEHRKWLREAGFVDIERAGDTFAASEPHTILTPF